MRPSPPRFRREDCERVKGDCLPGLPLQSRDRAEELGGRGQVAVLEQVGGEGPLPPAPELLRLGPRRVGGGGGYQHHLLVERELPLQLPLQAAAAGGGRALLLSPLLPWLSLHPMKRGAAVVGLGLGLGLVLVGRWWGEVSGARKKPKTGLALGGLPRLLGEL
jgi:hypothetical protein